MWLIASWGDGEERGRQARAAEAEKGEASTPRGQLGAGKREVGRAWARRGVRRLDAKEKVATILNATENAEGGHDCKDT